MTGLHPSDAARATPISAARAAGFRFTLLFVGLFILALPYPYHLLPDIGGAASPVTERLVRWVGDGILHLDHPYTAAVLSDSTGMYIFTLLVAIIAAIGAVIWSALAGTTRSHARLRSIFHAIISYYLSLQLLKYGLDKVFKSQFYLPEPNTLFTPIGKLAPDILYWSAMGASYGYTVFAGIVEVIPALLLLFRRTRSLGALWGMVVMANVVAINFGFDISVKLYSSFLLALCVIVAAPALERIARLLLFERRARPISSTSPFVSRHAGRYLALGKGLVVGAIILEALIPYIRANNFDDDRAARPALHGAYEVMQVERDHEAIPPLTTDSNRIRRIFIHRRGYLIAQTMDDMMRDYRLEYGPVGKELIAMEGGRMVMRFNYELADRDSTLTLRGTIRGDTVMMRMRRVDLNALPLLRGGFHWTIDGYR